MRRSLIGLTLLPACWYGPTRLARPAPPEPTVETSNYRTTTIVADAIGVGAMAVGLIGLQRGYNENVSGGLLVAGLTIAAYVTPIIHLAHGKRSRTGGSLLVRSIASTTGSVVGLAAGCPGGRGWFCGLEGMLWGVAGGLAVGSVIDAVYFHDESSPRTWTPTVMTSGGNARVGIRGSF